jgi:hypothetical protein
VIESGEIPLILVNAACRQFEAIGMTGWMRRAEELSNRLG